MSIKTTMVCKKDNVCLGVTLSFWTLISRVTYPFCFEIQ